MANKQTVRSQPEEAEAPQAPAETPAPEAAETVAEPTMVRERPRAVEAVEVAESPDTTQDGADLGSQRRRMPDKFRRYLLRVQGGKYYLPAAYRIVWFRDECPDWGVTTELIEGGQADGFATVRAQVCDPNGRVVATGMKTETQRDFPAGWVEKAETGSIARALAVAGFGTQFTPELDEMVDGQEAHIADSPQPMARAVITPMQRAATRVAESTPKYAQPGRTERDTPPAAAAPAVARPQSEIWEGPEQCPVCHAPQGKRHGKPCLQPA